jgi:hypothetical protein
MQAIAEVDLTVNFQAESGHGKRRPTDDKETDVEVFLSDCTITELDRLRCELVDGRETSR